MAFVKLNTRALGPGTLGRAATYKAQHVDIITATRAIVTCRQCSYWSTRRGSNSSYSRSPYHYSWRFHRLLRYGSSESDGSTSKSERPTEADAARQKQENTINNDKNSHHDDTWRGGFAEDFSSWRRAVHKMTKGELEALQRVVERNPHHWVFGHGARLAFDPFRKTREFAERYWGTGEFASDVEVGRYSAPSRNMKTCSVSSSPAGLDDVANSQPSVEMEEYIDPITLRRVTRPVERTKLSTHHELKSDSPSVSGNRVVQIPVKKYVQSHPVSDLNTEEISALSPKPQKENVSLAGFAKQPWLQQEGFSASTTSSKTPLDSVKVHEKRTDTSLKPPTVKTGSSISKDGYALARTPQTLFMNSTRSTASRDSSQDLERIQSSLDRVNAQKRSDHASRTTTPPSSPPSETTEKQTSQYSKDNLKYPAEENRTEDIDLLRAHNVRAASGHSKAKASRLSPEEARRRRELLSEEFDRSQFKLNKLLIKEFLQAIASDQPNNIPLMKLWTVYTQTRKLKGTKGEMSSNIKIMKNLINRIMLDDKEITSTQGLAQLITGEGTSMGRYLSANRISKSMDDQLGGFERINKAISTKDGYSIEDKQSLRTAFDAFRSQHETYKAELRRQILAVPVKPKTSEKSLKEKRADRVLASEIQQQKAAMQAYEERDRKQADTIHKKLLWEDNLDLVKKHEQELEQAKIQRQKQRDKKLYHEVKQIYEEAYGKINTGHRQQVKEEKEALPNTAEEIRAKYNSVTETTEQDSQIVRNEWSTALQEPTASLDVSYESVPAKPRSVNAIQEPVLVDSVQQSNSSDSLSRQLPPNTPTRAVVPSLSTTYRILTFKSSWNEEVVSATLKSSLPLEDPPKTPARIFMDLESVQPFIEEMDKLQDSGWELVDGGKRQLIFRKVETNEQSLNENAVGAETASTPTVKTVANDDQGTSNSQDAFPVASPNTTPNAILEPWEQPISSASPSNPTITVKRTEPFFTGTSESSSTPRQPFRKHTHRHQTTVRHPARTFRRRIRRFFNAIFWMLGAGLTTVLGIYAVGVLQGRLIAERRRQQDYTHLQKMRQSGEHLGEDGQRARRERAWWGSW